MTIAKKIEAALKLLNTTGEYTTSQLVDTVMKSNPTLNRQSVSRTLALLVEQSKLKGITRARVGVYKVGIAAITVGPKLKKAPAPAPVKAPKRKSASHKTAAAKQFEAAQQAQAQATPAVGKTYVGISRDHSASMGGLKNAALQDYNELLRNIKDGNSVSESTLTTVICGDHSSRASVEMSNKPVMEVKPLTHYSTPGGSTPLFDSIGLLIEQLSAIKAGPNDAFLVMIVTDGQENSSKRWNTNTIVSEIKRLQATDKWTFVFRVPRGTRRTIENWGIPPDNIQEWETTSAGMQASAQVTSLSMQNYYSGTRAVGQTNSAKFFVDASNIDTKALKRSLVDVSSEVRLLSVGANDVNIIRPFIKAKLGVDLKKGSAFYQLIKTETVQPQKDILIRVKRSGEIYHGPAARDLLNLPHSGNIRLAPGNHGDYDIYIQSTSVNRVLPVGSLVAYWDVHGSAFKSGL